MKAVIQRVTSADVKVDGQVKGSVGQGFMILFGAGHGDTAEEADWLAHKTANMRIFSDENGKMNLSIKDVGGSALVVSQFTLYADCRRGNRPSFTDACEPEKADELYGYFCDALRAEGVTDIQKGVFGADMKVSLVNDGPVTIILERDHRAE